MAQLKLSTADIAQALAGLSEVDRAELLELLQAAEEERAALPVDSRQPIDRLVEEARQARSGNPAHWLELDA